MSETGINDFEHCCDQMPVAGVRLYYDQGIGDVRADTWHLHLMREATEADLESNHHFENVGDPIWSLCVEVRFCPYCGHDLNTTIPDTAAFVEDRDTEGDFGRFALFDQDNWSGSLR